MSKKAITRLVSYSIAVLIGAGLAFLVIKSYGYSEATTDAVRYRILCDAFTIPGVLLLGCGLLSWISRQGTFDALMYGLRSLTRFFNRQDRHLRYYDFVMERREKREQKEKGSFTFLFVVGAAFLLLAGIFMMLFYRVY